MTRSPEQASTGTSLSVPSPRDLEVPRKLQRLFGLSIWVSNSPADHHMRPFAMHFRPGPVRRPIVVEGCDRPQHAAHRRRRYLGPALRIERSRTTAGPAMTGSRDTPSPASAVRDVLRSSSASQVGCRGNYSPIPRGCGRGSFDDSSRWVVGTAGGSARLGYGSPFWPFPAYSAVAISLGSSVIPSALHGGPVLGVGVGEQDSVKLAP
jgi:hypothetical protein